MSEEAPVAEKGRALVAAAAFPLRMVDSAKVTEPGRLGLFSAHQVVDGGAEGFAAVSWWMGLWLEAQDLTCPGKYPGTLLRGNNLRPNVPMRMLTRPPIEVAEQA